MVLVIAQDAADDESALRLTWLSAADGKALASASAGNLGREECPELVLPAENRLFLLVSRERKADLDVVELEPAMGAAESRF
jgi:hypothetical protein